MALAVNSLERAFTFERGNETITLSDPNPSMTPEQVMNFYANGNWTTGRGTASAVLLSKRRPTATTKGEPTANSGSQRRKVRS